MGQPAAFPQVLNLRDGAQAYVKAQAAPVTGS